MIQHDCVRPAIPLAVDFDLAFDLLRTDVEERVVLVALVPKVERQRRRGGVAAAVRPGGNGRRHPGRPGSEPGQRYTH